MYVRYVDAMLILMLDVNVLNFLYCLNLKFY